MAAIAVAPITMNNSLVKFGTTNEYQKHVSAVEFVPSASSSTWKGLAPDAVFTSVGKATWALNMSFAQDWETEDSLSLYLFENEGETVTLTFEPVAGGATITAQVIVTPGSIGGAVDSTAVSTVTLGVQGRPTIGA